MPQRQFWTTTHEVRYTMEFALDPKAPGAPPSLAFTVYDQSSQVVKSARYLLPPNDAELALYETCMAFHNGWIACDADAAFRAVRRSVQAWWDHAEEQATTR